MFNPWNGVRNAGIFFFLGGGGGAGGGGDGRCGRLGLELDSFLFFRFNQRSARVPERRSRQTRATNEGGGLALSVTLVVICVFRAFRSTD